MTLECVHFGYVLDTRKNQLFQYTTLKVRVKSIYPEVNKIWYNIRRFAGRFLLT